MTTRLAGWAAARSARKRFDSGPGDARRDERREPVALRMVVQRNQHAAVRPRRHAHDVVREMRDAAPMLVGHGRVCEHDAHARHVDDLDAMDEMQSVQREGGLRFDEA